MIQNKVINSRKVALLFKIKLNGTSLSEVLRFIRQNLAGFDKRDERKKFFLTTPNPEQILLAQKDKDFAKIINNSTLAIPDGVGILQANKLINISKENKSFLKPLVLFFKGLEIGLATFFNKKWLEDDLHLIHGRDLMLQIIKLANKKGWRIIFLGGSGDVAQKCVENLQKSYKNVKLLGLTGPNLTDEAKPITVQDQLLEAETIKIVSDFKPHVLFIGFGAPKQEKWAYRWLTTINCGGIMVVGGAIDYIAGKVKSPPKWVAKYELEWLWRLLTQKGRIRRVLTAFPVFPLKVYWYSIKNR